MKYCEPDMAYPEFLEPPMCRNCKYFYEAIDCYLLHEIHLPPHCRALGVILPVLPHFYCGNERFEEKK